MSDGDHLLRAVLDEPHEDSHRLVYADWLEDNGQPERAEFIRVSIREPPRSHLALTRDPFLLLGLEPGPPLLVPRLPSGQELRTWAWGEADARGLVVTDLVRGASYRVERGFVRAVTLTLAEFLRHAPALFAAHPIEVVRLSDRTPLDDAGAAYSPAEWWYWIRCDSGGARPPWEVPACLWEYLDGDDFCSQGAADVALSRACVAWGRRQAGLPPLTPLEA